MRRGDFADWIRRRARPARIAETALWVGLALFLGTRMWPQVAAAFGVSGAGTRAPDFRLVTLAGDTISRDDLRGKVVLVNFWATWCPPCRVEMPGFQHVYERNAKAGFVVLGISMDDESRDEVSAFLQREKISYPVAMATGAVVQDFGGAGVLPTSFLIDRRGRIRHEVRGAFSSLALNEAVRHLLAEDASDSTAGTPVNGGRAP